MRHFKIKFSTFAAILAGMFLLTACPVPDLTLSPSSLIFEAFGTGEQSVSIKSNASDWNIQSVSDSWIDASKKADGNLSVKVDDYFNANNSRTGTISIKVERRGKSATEEINIEQRKISPPPESTYSVSCTSLESNPPYNLSGWSGRFTPVLNANPQFYRISNWAGDDVEFYFDFVNGQFILDNYTDLFSVGQYDCYLVWGTITSTGYTVYEDEERVMPYNWSTRTFEAGTYNGLPVFFTIMGKHSTTHQWDYETYYYNIFGNFRMTLAASSYAAQPERSNVELGIVKKQFPSNMKVTFVKGNGQHSPRNINKK